MPLAKAYGKIRQPGQQHQLHDERHYEFLDALTTGIRQDCQDTRTYFALLPT